MRPASLTQTHHRICPVVEEIQKSQMAAHHCRLRLLMLPFGPPPGTGGVQVFSRPIQTPKILGPATSKNVRNWKIVAPSRPSPKWDLPINGEFWDPKKWPQIRGREFCPSGFGAANRRFFYRFSKFSSAKGKMLRTFRLFFTSSPLPLSLTSPSPPPSSFPPPHPPFPIPNPTSPFLPPSPPPLSSSSPPPPPPPPPPYILYVWGKFRVDVYYMSTLNVHLISFVM